MRAALPAPVLALVLAGTLVGCGGEDEPATSLPDTTPSAAASVTASPVPSSTPSGGPTPSTAPEPSTGASPSTASCGRVGTVVPDGRWQGPITLDVRGSGGQTGFADSTGKGRMTLTVENGKVTAGTWQVAWSSHGEVDDEQAAVTVDLQGRISGPVRGGAAKPALSGAWTIKGRTEITRPVEASEPFQEKGRDSETMTIKDGTCDRVTGTFVPSFTSKQAAVTFSGTATWTGTRR